MCLCIYTHFTLTVQTANLDMTVQYNLLYNFVFFSMLYYLKGVYFLYKMLSLAVLAFFVRLFCVYVTRKIHVAFYKRLKSPPMICM